MKHRAPKLNVPIDDPFQNDELGRENIAETLTQFLKATEEPLVLSIDAEWGQGKTTFIRMWRQMLSNEDFPTLYYSAWENDYNNDALVTIIGELEEEIDRLIDTDGTLEDKVNARVEEAKQLGSKILANSLPFILKFVTSGLVDLEKLEGEEFGDMVKSLAEKQINKYQESKKEVEDFKDNLRNLAKDLGPEGEYRPMVIFIDELDRCKPTFAIEVLERIKHLFYTPYVVFVLAIDKRQLIESIKTVYGANLNSSGYLKRFIDIEYSLPKPDVKAYSKALYKKFELDAYISNADNNVNREDAYYVLENIKQMVTSFGCTLRELEKCYSKIAYTFKITKRQDKLYPLQLSFLILLKIKEYALFKRFKDGKITVDKLFSSLADKSESLNQFVNSGNGIRVWALLCIAKNDGVKVNEKLDSLRKLANEGERENKELIERRIDELENDRNIMMGYNILDRIMEKIEMVDNFRR